MPLKDMTLSDLFQILILLTPIVLAWRGAKLWGLLASVGALHVATSILTKLLMAIVPFLFRPAGSDASFHDTYYVATPPGFPVTTAIIWATLALITWRLEYKDALGAPRLARGLFWTLLGAQAAGWFIPRLHMQSLVDFETAPTGSGLLSITALLTTITALLTLAGLIALLATSALTLARRPR